MRTLLLLPSPPAAASANPRAEALESYRKSQPQQKRHLNRPLKIAAARDDASGLGL
ncbi:uncharacterized protein H6S33_000921 [Morchella sextelata]|uniref:uncharacterized protein n=1 Tax=Morchella sextelata TaxID=1174677 RepID=UPI001D046BA7|nr:uncharacterized protein H6S33_000921 [Morchella sextelata]KAH0615285.1 hypothetical protein H6S33_000921 [Morchella sextelata]